MLQLLHHRPKVATGRRDPSLARVSWRYHTPSLQYCLSLINHRCWKSRLCYLPFNFSDTARTIILEHSSAIGVHNWIYFLKFIAENIKVLMTSFSNVKVAPRKLSEIFRMFSEVSGTEYLAASRLLEMHMLIMDKMQLYCNMPLLPAFSKVLIDIFCQKRICRNYVNDRMITETSRNSL